MGRGVNSNVYALAVSGADLYLGGDFVRATNASGVAVAAAYIARWNGAAWSALGAGLNGSVYALVACGTDLYAGGAFTTAGNTNANRVAKWNGTSWSPLGTGVDNVVRSLAIVGGALYAGGDFTGAGGAPAKYVARWNGTTWSNLGSEVNRAVYGLAGAACDLYVGGLFSAAGATASGYAAKASIPAGDWLSIQTGVPGPNTNTLRLQAIPNYQYTVEFATNLTASSWCAFASNTVPSDGVGIVQDPTATNHSRFYRLHSP